eukprot:scaffold186901_cov28-Tisochrysis_lutea.AAC.1
MFFYLYPSTIVLAPTRWHPLYQRSCCLGEDSKQGERMQRPAHSLRCCPQQRIDIDIDRLACLISDVPNACVGAWRWRAKAEQNE